jgi:RNA polymerase sigma factor (sigma-70 family)
MRAGQLDGVIRQLCRVALQDPRGELGDAELLERFLAHRDEGAFEVLVRRHGPMVLGVCHRVLRNQADAEDAFQATFVVFIRKASSIIPRTQVGPWLYGVAHKTALKAKAMSQRRRLKEREAGTAPKRTAADDRWASLLEILDAEVNALPERYRTPIVLCDLEGLSYREAAARLGCPQGTLSGRLTRARVLLARRVARHGLPLTAGALVTLLARNASACLSPSVLAGTIRARAGLAGETALSVGAVSTTVASLAEGVLKMLLWSKLKLVTGLVLFVAAAVIAGWMGVAQISAHAIPPRDGAVPLTDDDPRALAPKNGAGIRPTDSREAEFVFRGTDRRRKTVALVVAGTSAPVFNLPVKDDLRVHVGGRPLGIDALRSGARISIRMDSTASAIQEIRALAHRRTVASPPSATDLEHLKPPSEGEVLRAIRQGRRGVPGVYDVSRGDIQIVAERLVDFVDPPRMFPGVGEAQRHHCHWKCTVYYHETVESSHPFPFRSVQPCVEVVYIDKDYLIPNR